MRFNSGIQPILEDALENTRIRRHVYCTAEHLLATLLNDDGPISALDLVEDHLAGKRKLPAPAPEVKLSAPLYTYLEEGCCTTNEPGSGGVIDATELLAYLLRRESPTDSQLRQELKVILRPRMHPAQLDPVPAGPSRSKETDFLRPWTEPEELTCSVDRPELVGQMVKTLMYSNPLVVGREGSGRSVLMHLVARRLSKGPVPDDLRDRELLLLDPIAMMAGTTYRGELEERVQNMLAGFRLAKHPPIVFVEDLSLLVGDTRSAGSIDIASALLSDLKAGCFQLVGRVGEEPYRDQLEKSSHFLTCFRGLRLPDLSQVEAVNLLSTLPEKLGRNRGFRFDPEIVTDAVDLTQEHLPHHALPGSAQKILEEAIMSHVYEHSMQNQDAAPQTSRYWSIVAPDSASQQTRLEVGKRHLMLALSQLHGIPFEHLESDAKNRLANFNLAFRGHIFGQDQVLDVLQRAIKVGLKGLTPHRKPRCSLFFLGPPGTGKTETARLLARHLMGSEDALLQFNMSEFCEPSSVSSLIGSDKGLVGSDEGGRLTEPLRRNPHRVLLFDEIEKGTEKVFDIFLSILGAGECHDKRNLPVSFRHAFCIFTSNAGGDGSPSGYPTGQDQIIQRLRGTFRPEFLDRIDDFVTYGALGQDARREVAQFQLQLCRDQIAAVHGLDLKWSEKVLDMVSPPNPNQPGVRDIGKWVQSVVKPQVCDLLIESDPPPSRALQLGCDAEGSLCTNWELEA